MSTLISLLFHLVKEYLGLETNNKLEPKERRDHYMILAFIIVITMLSVALMLVTFRAVANSEELIRYKREVAIQLEECSLKNHQDDSFDRGNGIDPSKIRGLNLAHPTPCQDYWCK